MITQYFSLLAQSIEFDRDYRGAAIDEVFTQQKNELIVTVSMPAGGGRSFIISIEPSRNYIVVRPAVARAKKNSVDLFAHGLGSTITRVDMYDYDRTLRVKLSNNLTLMMQMYNTATSNVFLIDANGKVVEAFKRNKEFEGTVLAQGEKRFDENVIEDLMTFREALIDNPSQTAYAALKRVVPIFGSTYAREALVRSRVDEKSAVKNLSDNDSETLYNEVRALFQQTQHPKPCVYVMDNEEKFLSTVPLTHLSGSKSEMFAGMNDAVIFLIKSPRPAQGNATEDNALLVRINGELERTRRSLAASTDHYSAADRASEYDRNGNLIMAHLTDIAKGMREVDLTDMFSDGKVVRVSLDPKRSPVQNAEQYFEKAKKAKAARRESAKRIEELKQHAALLEDLVLPLSQCRTPEEVREFKNAHHDILVKLKFITPASNEQLPPFRVFTVAGGYEVWVGKSSANNDLLTMKYARPHDLWFHARGSSGSHTVLKVKGGSPPPKEAIRQAAAIAAYYSKMRNANTVPVAYCERKYVRKPKRANEGAVVLEREEVVFVQPRLP